MISFFPSRQIILSIGNVAIRWYGLMYVLSFAVVYYLGQRLQKYRRLKLTADEWLFIVFCVVVGAVIGGRLGYVFFYEPVYYLHYWPEILFVWHGGMSAHGGVIGAAVGIYLAARQLHMNMWSLADVLMVPAAIGLALGRVGNFINQEIYGTITSVPWAVVIPGVAWPRHPWPLYEAMTNLILGLVAAIILRKVSLKPGILTAGCVMGYSLIRFLLEYIRNPEWPFVPIGSLAFTPGQLLSLLIFAGGGFLMVWLLFPSKNSIKG